MTRPMKLSFSVSYAAHPLFHPNGDTLHDLRCTIALQCTGWQIYDESWASFRVGNWRRDFRLGGGGDSGGSWNSSRRVRAEHAAVRQDRRRSAALARRAAQTGIRPNRRAHEETECVFHPLYEARPRFQSPPAFGVGLFGGGSRQWRVARPGIGRAGSRAVRRQRPRLPKSLYLLVQPQERKGLSRTAL